MRVDTVSDKGGKRVHVVSFLEGTLQVPIKGPSASGDKEITLQPLRDGKPSTDWTRRRMGILLGLIVRK